MAEHGTQTERVIEYVDCGTDCLRLPSRSTQTAATDVAGDKNPTEKLRIDPQIVEMILETLAACEAEKYLFQPLDEFRRDDVVELIYSRSTEIPEAERGPIVDIIGGGNSRVAVLFGEPHHDSWCEHVDGGHVLVFQRMRFAASPIRLPNCPTTALFRTNNQIVVGTMSGELIFCGENGEIFWQNAKVHSRAITALNWLRQEVLLSCGLDGRVALSSLAVSGVEFLKHVDVKVGDLPRGLRPANSGVIGRAVGIACADVSEDGEIFLIGETGAIWSADAKDLLLHSLGFEGGGISRFQLSATSKRSSRSLETDFLIIQTLNRAIKLKTRKSLAASSQQLNISESDAITFVLKPSANLLICAFDKGEIVGVDLVTKRTVLRQMRAAGDAAIISMAICDKDQTLVILSDDFKLTFFNFSIDI